MKAVPVFMYHHVNWRSGDLVTLNPLDFENHLQVLAEKRIQTLFLDELLEFLTERKRFACPAVALTFDDGHLDNWVYAFPLLKKYGAKATIFVVTSWIGSGKRRARWDGIDRKTAGLPEIPSHREAKRRFLEGDFSGALNWEEAKEMEASGLVDIQSHTHSHGDYFSGPEAGEGPEPLRTEELFRDLQQSKNVIEARLGKTCRFLAWPWGRHNPEAVAMARKAGFAGIATTEKGVNFPGADPLAIKRIVAKSGDRGWFSTRHWIYSHPRIGKWYSRVVGRI